MKVKDLKKHYPDIYAFAKKRRDDYTNYALDLGVAVRSSHFIDWGEETNRRKTGVHRIIWSDLLDYKSTTKLTSGALNYWAALVSAGVTRNTTNEEKLYSIY